MFMYNFLHVNFVFKVYTVHDRQPGLDKFAQQNLIKMGNQKKKTVLQAKWAVTKIQNGTGQNAS